MESQKSIEEKKQEARDLNEIVEWLIDVMDKDDKRFTFVMSTNGYLTLYDKEKDTAYGVTVERIKYNDDEE